MTVFTLYIVYISFYVIWTDMSENKLFVIVIVIVIVIATSINQMAHGCGKIKLVLVPSISFCATVHSIICLPYWKLEYNILGPEAQVLKL